MDLSPLTSEEKASSYVVFTAGGLNSKPEKVQFNSKNVNASGRYYFTCHINSVQMAENITAVFHFVRNGEDRTVQEVYVMTDYFSAFDQHENEVDPFMAEVIKATADYGHFMQPLLALTNHWTIGTNFKEITKFYKESFSADEIAAVRNAVADKGIVRDLGSSDIESIGFQMRFDSNTEIILLIKLKSGYTGPLSITVDGTQVAAHLQCDGRYRVSIVGIGAQHLDRVFTMVAETTSGTATVTCSGLSYVNALVNYSNSDENVQAIYVNAGVALYNYYYAAEQYTAHNSANG